MIRSLRLLRIFRVLKLGHFLGEARPPDARVCASLSRKIVVFLGAVSRPIVLILGAVMYLIEGPENGFTSIPARHLLGHRDHDHGRLRRHRAADRRRADLASVVMILGYGIIAVPTGIVTAEIATSPGRRLTPRSAPTASRGARLRRPLLQVLRRRARLEDSRSMAPPSRASFDSAPRKPSSSAQQSVRYSRQRAKDSARAHLMHSRRDAGLALRSDYPKKAWITEHETKQTRAFCECLRRYSPASRCSPLRQRPSLKRPPFTSKATPPTTTWKSRYSSTRRAGEA